MSNKNTSHTKILEHIEKKQNVLEVGCSVGYMTRYLQEVLRCQVTCVEIDEKAAKAAEPYSQKMVVDDIENTTIDAKLNGNLFDVIILADIIEHLVNPAQVLERLKKFLKPSGLMLLSIPNGAHGSVALEIIDGRWNYMDKGLLDRGHLHFYDKYSIFNLLQESGLFVASFDRVIIHPRDTELQTPWEHYPKKVTKYIEKTNHEFTTYQFIIKAYPSAYKLDDQSEIENKFEVSQNCQSSTTINGVLMKIFPVDSMILRSLKLVYLVLVTLKRDGFLLFCKKFASQVASSKITINNKRFQIQKSIQYRKMSFREFDLISTTIIIPIFNHAKYTYQCLKSIKQNTVTPYEIIVVDNASDNETRSMLSRIKGIRIIRNPENLGFVKACNIGASKARGSYLLFLNNDTKTTPGWLEALLEPFANDNVGIVGAKLVYPDGTLQEAGGIVWGDGNACNYGHGDDPNLPQYSYVREVDYCSGACLAVRNDVWNKIGGFDPRFSPAYYEDTDLCFSARKLGYKVIFQPFAKVFHYRGITAGNDVTKGFKKYQEVNRLLFCTKWKSALDADHYENQAQLFTARERKPKKVILVVDERLPEYDKDSGSLRMFNILRILTDMGHKVIFWPDGLTYKRRYTEALQKLGVEALYGNISFSDYLKNNRCFIDLIFLSRPELALNYFYTARRYSDAKIFYDTVDLHFLREERRAQVSPCPVNKTEIQENAKYLKKLELFLVEQADRVLVVSPYEKLLLENKGYAAKVAVLPNIHEKMPCKTPFSQREGIMFIGGFRHNPNEDGIIWFVEKIFPLISKAQPKIALTIVGNNPTKKVLSYRSDCIIVTGYMENVTPYFEKSKLSVCPLRYGAGIKGKIGQSMAHGLPVVTTNIGAEGMGLTDNENVLIADNEDLFAEKVLNLYNCKELWERISSNSQKFIDDHFSFEAVKKKMIPLFDD